jgi:hypothetical protein
MERDIVFSFGSGWLLTVAGLAAEWIVFVCMALPRSISGEGLLSMTDPRIERKALQLAVFRL